MTAPQPQQPLHTFLFGPVIVVAHSDSVNPYKRWNDLIQLIHHLPHHLCQNFISRNKSQKPIRTHKLSQA
jgi:hypothetical protein